VDSSNQVMVTKDMDNFNFTMDELCSLHQLSIITIAFLIKDMLMAYLIMDKLVVKLNMDMLKVIHTSIEVRHIQVMCIIID
jgi:hypothetical protein